MEQETVSIIMPSYNTAQYITSSIESVIAQTYENWELIIVDDCSVDKTKELLQQYSSNKKIKQIYLNKNSGAAFCRNLALKNAIGKWIAFLDSDDIWYPTKLEDQIAFMKTNNYHFSYTEYEEIDENGKLNGTKFTGPLKISNGLMHCCNFMGCLTVMYDREYIGLIQIDNLKKRNDYAVWLKVVQKCPAYLLKKTLAQYRVRNSDSLMDRKKGRMHRIRYSYYLWRNGEHLSVILSMFLTVVNSCFAIAKSILYKK